MVGHIDTSGRMIIESHNDLRGDFLCSSIQIVASYLFHFRDAIKA